ncbi:hypothetical protein O0I10_005927 [Lichtheimia ornata]|uniref:GATA-type domain-containing protein n=1 Tax=Lichtheimia ornata TaxID=688661 RepID=A0AAD7V4T4_9FUNG|nr:uncharacterized protein O0I10_005927 [Lichtheimia ornata]KAJ8658245.1 hypothetical protein O0I10_005927 [Lichtheimia ornata]
MDISALCSTSSEECDALPSPHSPTSPHRPESDARALEQLDHGAPNTSTQPTFRMTSNVQLPKLRYPTSAPPPPAATTTTTTTPTTSIHEYLPVPSVNSSTLLHDTSKTSISPDTTPLPPYSPIQPCVDINQIIGQCASLCQDLDRCRDQDWRSRSEIDWQQLLDNAAHTAQSLLSSLGMLQEHQLRTGQKRSHNDAEIEVKDSEYALIRQARPPQDDTIRPKIKRRTKRSTAGQRCHSCHTTETPEWRRGPDGARTLCNACGLHYSKLLRKGALTVQSDRQLLENGTAKINATPINRPNISIVHYPIIQVQAKPAGNGRGDGIRFINRQLSYPQRNDSKPYNHSNSPSTTSFIHDHHVTTTANSTARIVEIEEE